MEIPVPRKQALTETPEYENSGANGFEKSILPVYSISGLLALIVSETVANALPIARERIKINTRIFFTINSFKLVLIDPFHVLVVNPKYSSFCF